MPEHDVFASRARERGPLPDGSYRVVAAIDDAPFSVTDFTSRDEAIAYANDVEWESHAQSLAIVFDHRFARVHVGTRG